MQRNFFARHRRYSPFKDSHIIRKRQIMKAKTTWILVANGTHAIIACNRGPGQGLEPNLEHEFRGPNLHNREIMSDSPGRAFDSARQGRHAMEPATDPQRSNQQSFAREIAAHIDSAADRNLFDHLVLVAAPQMLGELRKCLSNTASAKVTGELPKDLTNLPIHKLPDHLGAVMAI
jgi:protein required for attachment to host cells